MFIIVYDFVSLIGTNHIFCQARDFAPGSRETGKGVPSKELGPDDLRFVESNSSSVLWNS